MKYLKWIILFSLAFNSSAYCQCSCVGYYDMDSSPAVFEGRVLGIKEIMGFDHRYEITVETSNKIKGNIDSPIMTVYVVDLRKKVCGIPFKLHKKYRFFTFFDATTNSLWVGGCTRTKRIRNRK